MINRTHNPPINNYPFINNYHPINTINNLNKPQINTSENQRTIPDNPLINNTSIQDNITLSNNIQIQINKIMEKLQKLEITNKDLLYKILDRLTIDKQKIFLNELQSLIDTLSSKYIEKKLHPKVVKAIKKSTNGLSRNKVKREFETLKDFAIKLLTDLIDVLADPNLIFQQHKGTCVKTIIERSIAERNPTQYVKIITDLITKGEYIAPNGQRIPLNEGGIKKALFEIDNRYLTTRIITPSLMEFYYDKDPNKNDYDDDRDEPSGSLFEKTASAIYNTEYNSIDVGYFNKFNNTQKTLILKTLLKKSKYPIFLAVNYRKDPNDNNALHGVELKSITDNSITISNPWGQIETYTTTGKNIEPASKNTKIQNYQDFIKRITFIIFSKELLLLAIKSEPLLSKLLPNIYYPKKMK